MKKVFLFSFILIGLTSCGKPKDYNKVTIESNDSTKVVQLEVVQVDSNKVLKDTAIFVVPKNTSDSVILEATKAASKEIKAVTGRREPFSPEKAKKVRQKINGGTNGLKETIDIWLRARQVLSDTTKTK